MEPGPGKIAFCSANLPGLILSEKPEEVTYPDGSKGVAWTGIHLSKERFGQPWSSRSPRVVCNAWDALVTEADWDGFAQDRVEGEPVDDETLEQLLSWFGLPPHLSEPSHSSLSAERELSARRRRAGLDGGGEG